MAIQKSFISKHGVTAEEAYHRVDTIDIDRRKKKNAANVIVRIYKSSQDHINGAMWLDRVDFNFEMAMGETAADAVSQAYTALKLLSDVEGIDYTKDTIDV